MHNVSSASGLHFIFLISLFICIVVYLDLIFSTACLGCSVGIASGSGERDG